MWKSNAYQCQSSNRRSVERTSQATKYTYEACLDPQCRPTICTACNMGSVMIPVGLSKLEKSYSHKYINGRISLTGNEPNLQMSLTSGTSVSRGHLRSILLLFSSPTAWPDNMCCPQVANTMQFACSMAPETRAFLINGTLPFLSVLFKSKGDVQILRLVPICDVTHLQHCPTPDKRTAPFGGESVEYVAHRNTQRFLGGSQDIGIARARVEGIKVNCSLD